MTLREIVDSLEATVHLGEGNLDTEVSHAFASDLMSEVLTLSDTPLLITGLCNMQTIRTCDMANIDQILLVRNTKPTDEMLELAEDNDMTIISCRYSMFKTCGILFQKGLLPLY